LALSSGLVWLYHFGYLLVATYFFIYEILEIRRLNNSLLSLAFKFFISRIYIVYVFDKTLALKLGVGVINAKIQPAYFFHS